MCQGPSQGPQKLQLPHKRRQGLRQQSRVLPPQHLLPGPLCRDLRELKPKRLRLKGQTCRQREDPHNKQPTSRKNESGQRQSQEEEPNGRRRDSEQLPVHPELRLGVQDPAEAEGGAPKSGAVRHPAGCDLHRQKEEQPLRVESQRPGGSDQVCQQATRGGGREVYEAGGLFRREGGGRLGFPRRQGDGLGSGGSGERGLQFSPGTTR